MSRLARRVQRAIGRLSAEYRGTATYRHVVPGEYSFATDTRTGDSETTGTADVVVLPADPRTFGEALVAVDRRTLIVAALALPFAPGPGDQFDLEDWRWTVSGVKPIAPNGVDVLFKLDVQGAPLPSTYTLNGDGFLDGSYNLSAELVEA